MDAGAGQHVGTDPLDQRAQQGRAAADLIGQGRQADRHALAGVALRLTVQGEFYPKIA